MKKDKKNKIESDPKLRNQIPLHKKSSSYGGYGGNSPANMEGAINEFEDNSTIDSDNDSEEGQVENDENSNNSEGQESESLDRNRAESFDRMKNGTERHKQKQNKEKEE